MKQRATIEELLSSQLRILRSAQLLSETGVRDSAAKQHIKAGFDEAQSLWRVSPSHTKQRRSSLLHHDTLLGCLFLVQASQGG